jgi:hypothetical protein
VTRADLSAAVWKLDVTRAGVIAGGGILVIWLVGVAHATGLVSLQLFDLDEEGTVPQAYSGLLLVWAAAAALGARQLGAQPRRALMFVACVFAFMSLDEVFRLHEALDSAVQFDWQVLYLPVFVIALVGWVGVARSLAEEPRARLGWIGGAACWIVAQVLELFQWDGRVRPGEITSELSEAQVEQKLTEASYLVKMLPEELLEMVGSLMFALVLTHLLRRFLLRVEARDYVPAP